MSETEDTGGGGKLRDEDRAFMAAAAASGHVATVLDAGDDELAAMFAGLGEAPFWELATLVLFVRDNPAAPPEAVFRHAVAAGAFPGEEADGWTDQTIGRRVGMAVFVTVLLLADRELRIARGEPVPEAPYRPAWETDPENTVFGAGQGPHDTVGQLVSDVGRPMRIIPAQGEVPGHVRTPRPAAGLPAAPPPIGPENTIKVGADGALPVRELTEKTGANPGKPIRTKGDGRSPQNPNVPAGGEQTITPPKD